MDFESLPTVLSNSHAFHCFTAAGFVILLSCISQLEYMKFSSPSNITANHVEVFHFCIWLFWTNSLVLNLNWVISFILLSVKLITLNKTLLDIFPIFLNCVWACPALRMKLCNINCQLYHLTVITSLDISSAHGLSCIYSLEVPLPPIVHQLYLVWLRLLIFKGCRLEHRK
jgi:hypothetical protein